MKDVQELYALQKFIPAHLSGLYADETKPHFTVSVRTNGPWVGMVKTNYFGALVRGYELVTGLMDGSGDYVILVERLVQDKDDDTRYLSTVLEEFKGG